MPTGPDAVAALRHADGRLIAVFREDVCLWRVRVAATPWRRLRGLLGCRELAPGTGLLLIPCRAIHTVGMRFPIDVVFLTRAGVVTRARTAPPGRLLVWGGWAAAMALEVPAGEADTLRPGLRLSFRLLRDKPHG